MYYTYTLNNEWRIISFPRKRKEKAQNIQVMYLYTQQQKKLERNSIAFDDYKDNNHIIIYSVHICMHKYVDLR